MELEALFYLVLTLFILILVGWTVRRVGIFTDEVTAGVSSLLVNVALPALVIDSMQLPFDPGLAREGMTVALIGAAYYIAVVAVALVFPRLIRARPDEQSVFSFLVIFANTGFMGYPVVNAIWGNEAVFLAAIYNLLFSFLLFTVGILIISGAGADWRGVSPRVLLSPGIVSVGIGLALFLLSIDLPEVIGGPIAMLGDVTTPLSMVVIGALLARLDVRAIFGNLRVYVYAGFRLLVIPLATLVVLRPFVDDPLILGVLVIMAAMPGATNAALFAEEYGVNPELASQSVFITTLFCILTIPLVATLVA
ncbi:Membrane transport protein [anaerobic digester metagenome]